MITTATTSVAPAGPGESSGEQPIDTQPSPDRAEIADDPTIEFIALMDEALASTIYAGAALAEPDVFVATGRLFCQSLEAGTAAEDLVSGYVMELEGGPIDLASDDSLVLAGALLGAAVATLCPESASAVP